MQIVKELQFNEVMRILIQMRIKESRIGPLKIFRLFFCLEIGRP